jgi:hypothetical protein
MLIIYITVNGLNKWIKLKNNLFLITQNGRSLMMKVANGMGDFDQLPIFIRIPYLRNDLYGDCWERYSCLGLGDIIIPGILVGLCRSFDLARGNGTYIYYLTSLIGTV